MGFEDLMLGLSREERQELARRQTQFLRGQGKILGELDSKIASKESDIQATQKAIVETYEPNGRNGFLEAEGFEGFTTLQFFYEIGKFLDKAFSPALAGLTRIRSAANRVSRDGNSESSLGLVDMLEDAKNTVEVIRSVCEVRDKGVFPFEEIVKHTYQRSIVHNRQI